MKKNKILYIKKIEYWTDNNGDFSDKKLALALFNLLEFNKNIVIYASRAYNNDISLNKFAQKTYCKIIKDFSRSDCFILFIPTLKDNLDLFELIASMDTETEWNYIPSVDNFESLLFNWEKMNRTGVIRYGFSAFEAVFDMDFGLHFNFDLRYYEENKIEAILEDWENMFKGLKYKKTIKR